jgi:hypothetical protein
MLAEAANRFGQVRYGKTPSDDVVIEKPNAFAPHYGLVYPGPSPI